MRKHLIYLASGNSKRFGNNKLLYMYKGKPLYLFGLETLESIAKKEKSVTLLVVSQYKEIRQIASEKGIRAVDSPESAKGISYSIRAGIQAIDTIEPEDYLLFMVADQPRIKEEYILQLLSHADSGAVAASMLYGDKPGNPTLFSAKLLPHLLALSGDTGGRKILRSVPCQFVSAPKEDGIDIDRLEDFCALL